VFNVVNGDKEVVDAILAHPDIQAASAAWRSPSPWPLAMPLPMHLSSDSLPV
jgi:hypothetical protein